MIRRLLCLFAVCSMFCSPLLADFSDAVVSLHPTYPGSGPFLISISGTWPTDCHPGEQLPVVRSFDGLTVEIEYQIIVEHVTCNDVRTRYGSLVDMAEELDSTPAQSGTLNVRVDFDGAILEQTLELICTDGEDCVETPDHALLPERGLYVTPSRSREGLLVARQNQFAVVYLLVYNESGGAEWLFSAAPVDDGTYFSELIRLNGGDCFDCEPSGAPAEMVKAGHVSVFTEAPDTLWVKINSGPFLRYQKLVYGYAIFDRKEGRPLADLAGRWALSENYGTNPPLGDLSELLPPAFEIALQNTEPDDETSGEISQVIYLVTSITGQELGQLVCDLQSTPPEAAERCSFIDPTDQAEPLLLFYSEGPSTLTIEYGRLLPAIGTRPGGKAIRLD